MSVRPLLVVLAMFTDATPAESQHGGGPQAGASSANRTAPAESSTFNFLIGQWELLVKPAPTGLAQRIHGTPKVVGVWKAWRALDGWGIEDELRMTDGSGNPIGLSHAVRFYDAPAKMWRTSSIDVYRGVFTQGTAQWRKDAMITSSRGTDAESRPYVSRGRYSPISRDAFRFVQERSLDNGKTWKENLTIDAKRVAATASR